MLDGLAAYGERMRVVGVTGTRHEPPPAQAGMLGVVLTLAYHPGSGLALGDCSGVDALAYELGRSIGYKTLGFPPIDGKHRAHKVYDQCAQPASYAARDAAIVASAERLVAVPEAAEALSPRSGTWLTVRYARRRGIPIRIVWPDGSVTEDREEPR